MCGCSDTPPPPFSSPASPGILFTTVIFPPLSLPHPTGPHPVGVVDTFIPLPSSASFSTQSHVNVRVLYPATPDSPSKFSQPSYLMGPEICDKFMEVRIEGWSEVPKLTRHTPTPTPTQTPTHTHTLSPPPSPTRRTNCISNPLWSSLHFQFGAPPFLKKFGFLLNYWLLVKPRIYEGAPLASIPSQLPVVVHSHGLGGTAR